MTPSRKQARFPEKLSNLAIKAAEQLKLSVLKVTTDEVAKIAAQLPVGRINANGSGFIPYVSQDLYQKLLAIGCDRRRGLAIRIMSHLPH
jgi:hypothetical protein